MPHEETKNGRQDNLCTKDDQYINVNKKANTWGSKTS